MQPKTVRLSYSLSLSVLPDFISQDYRFGFLSTIKHNSSLLIGAFFLIPFHREWLQWPTNGPGSGFSGSARTWKYFVSRDLSYQARETRLWPRFLCFRSRHEAAFHEIYLPNGPAARFGPLYEKPTFCQVGPNL